MGTSQWLWKGCGRRSNACRWILFEEEPVTAAIFLSAPCGEKEL
jgi:hypothetical protein